VLLPLVWSSRLLFVLELSRWLGKNHKSVDVMHVHESDWLAGVAQCLGHRWGIPVLSKTATATVLPRLGFDAPFRRKWDRMRRECYFICQHRGQLDDLIASGINKRRVFLLPNGVEIPEQSACLEKMVERVLYVGNFTQGVHWKAFDVLIKAWSTVNERLPQAVLVMVGGGNCSPWKSLAEKYGCLESIFFQGTVPSVSPFYLEASLLVLPSRVEGLSNALLEAQSFGLPCVVSDIPGNRAVVEDGLNGLVVPLDDPESLAKAIIFLATKTEVRLAMGASARARIIADFSMDSVVDKLLRIYSEIVETEPDTVCYQELSQPDHN
jgi:glycosyltransferase involved in cell wall biosynthesis